jgi:hypothetical protein
MLVRGCAKDKDRQRDTRMRHDILEVFGACVVISGGAG